MHPLGNFFLENNTPDYAGGVRYRDKIQGLRRLFPFSPSWHDACSLYSHNVMSERDENVYSVLRVQKSQGRDRVDGKRPRLDRESGF